MSGAEPLTAWLVGLEAAPASVGHHLGAGDWVVEPVTLARLQSERIPPFTAAFLWVGDQCDAGLVGLRNIRAAVTRASTVLVGRGAGNVSSFEMGDRVRESGGLGVWCEDAGSDILSLVADATRRLGRFDSFVEDQALAELSQELGRSPEAVGRAAANVAGAVLCADLALLAVLPHGQTEFHYLSSDPEGISPVQWKPRPEAPNPPQDLCTFAHRNQRTVVVPDLERQPDIHAFPDVPSFRAAVAVPLAVQAGPHDAPEPAVLAVYWREPRLPTNPELHALRVLSAVAGTAWSRRPAIARTDAVRQAVLDTLETLPGLARTTQTPVPLQPPADSAPVSLEIPSVPDLRDVVRRYVEAYDRAPGLVSLWVWIRVAGSTDAWVSARGGEPPPALRSRFRADRTSKVNEPFGEGRKLFIEPIRLAPDSIPAPWVPDLGAVVAILEDKAYASDGLRDVRLLAADLRLAFRTHRNAQDDVLAARLADELAQADMQKPMAALATMGDLIRAELAADGCKVSILVVHQGKVTIQQIHRSGKGERKGAHLPLENVRGFAESVIRHGDWLVSKRVDGPDGSLRYETWRSAAGAVALEPTETEKTWPGEPPEFQRYQLLVPLMHQGVPVGALGLWRSADVPFDPVLDVTSLRRLAPHIGSACVRIAAIETVHAQVEAVAGLTTDLESAKAVVDVVHAALQRVNDLAASAHVVLLGHDPDRPGVLRYSNSRSHHPSASAELDAIRRWSIDLGTDASLWGSYLQTRVAALKTSLVVRQTLLLPAVADPGNDVAPPDGAIVLIDYEDTAPHMTFEQAVKQSLLGALVRFLAALLRNNLKARALSAARAMFSTVQRRDNPDAIIQRAIEVIVAQIPQAAVLVHFGDAPVLRLRGEGFAPPAAPELILDEPSLALEAIKTGKLLRVSELSDPTEPHHRFVNRRALAEIVRALHGAGWRNARSLVAAPMVYAGRARGVIKVLTPDPGPCLTHEHCELIETVAQSAAHEAERAQWASMVRHLTEVTSKHAGGSRTALAGPMLQGLAAWAQAHLTKVTGVALIARAGIGTFLHCADRPTFDMVALDALSRKHDQRTITWSAEERDSVAASVSAAGIAMPLKLAGRDDLRGHMFVLGASHFDERDQRIVSEAAREISLLLYGEVVAEEMRWLEGIFRHAIVGPAQGLASAAIAIADATSGLQPADVSDAADLNEGRRVVLVESEVLRLSAETQRMLAPLRSGKDLDLVLNNVSLYEVVQQCRKRYEPVFLHRGIFFEAVWPEDLPHGVTVRADRDLLEVAICNLLDNAGKYAFFNREASLQVALTHYNSTLFMQIRIEDIGTGIPKDRSDAIYVPWGRLEQRDPTRSIQGEGLGLYLARRIADAHDGTLSHTCSPVGRDATDPTDKTPYRVQFDLMIPTRWPHGRPRGR